LAEDSLFEEVSQRDEDSPLVEQAIDELEAISLELSADDEPATDATGHDQKTSQYEPALIEVFRKEAATHIATVREFLLNANGEATTVDDELHRAFHTLHGSARMANVASISELSEATDRLIRAMHERAMAVDNDGQSLLYQIADAIKSLITHFDTDNFVPADNSALLTQIAELHESALSTPLPTDSTPASSAAAKDSVPIEEDAELITIFVDEAGEILRSTDTLMQQWLTADEADLSAITELQRTLHTLKGGARLANFAAIGDLTHELESLLEHVVEGRYTATEPLPSVIQQGLDWLTDAIRQVRNGTPVNTADTLLSQFNDLASSNAMPDVTDQLPSELINSAVDDLIPTDDLLLDSLTEDTTEKPLEEFEEIAENTLDDILEDALDEQENPDTFSAETDTASTALDVDYDPDLLEIFLEEAEEIQENSDHTLQQWATQNDNLDHVTELQRLLHTLKGGARMANVPAVGDLAHAMESLLERITEKYLVTTPEHISLIQTCHDWLIGALEQAQKLQPTTVPADLMAQLEAAIKGEEYSSSAATITAPKTPSGEMAVPAKPHASDNLPDTATLDDADAGEMEELTTAYTFDTPEVIKTAKKTSSADADEQVRVRADLLNNLVNFSGEINIYNSRIAQQLSATRFNLAELDQTVQRLREQLRKFEIETETQIMYRHETTSTDTEDFDPLELDRFSTMQQISRGMVESLGDLTSIEALLENLSGETDVLLLQQQRVTSELQEGLMRTRMVAFSSILPRLRRIMRQTCKEIGKEADLLVTGGEGELDRSQLNRIIPALEHILRNAIGHGLEMPKDREKAGKPVSGNVHIVFSHEGSEVVLSISDDGAGINIDALRKKAIEKSHMLADADLSDTEIIEFILKSGFSTADKVTQISGRGVGMDVVNTEVKQLGGTLHIDSRPGKGSTFTLRLPLTVLVNQALMVQVADATYAIQLPNIEHVVRVGGADLEPLVRAEKTHFDYAGTQYQYLNLGTILHGTPPVMPPGRQHVPLMLIRSAEHRIALHVDHLMGRQEIVIKSVGPQLSSVGVLSGATILPDGEVALILDVGNLVRSAVAQIHGNAEPLLPSIDAAAAAEIKMPTVMIVDDSITVRKVTERLLKRYEYNIITAKDGVDALTVMLEQIPDIMLLDVEMPRMDGYELATTMRNDARLKTVPIIMITSRTGDKHRQRALKIGVNMYMGKPYQEQELIDNVRILTGAEQS